MPENLIYYHNRVFPGRTRASLLSNDDSDKLESQERLGYHGGDLCTCIVPVTIRRGRTQGRRLSTTSSTRLP